MFTIEQIKSAHSKVKSGADFPKYIQEIKRLGVMHYETFVTDGHTSYHGKEGLRVEDPAKYPPQVIGQTPDSVVFRTRLIAHQKGQTDYPTFRNDCAESGILKWVVDLEKMTCTYFDLAGNEVLVEKIPE